MTVTTQFAFLSCLALLLHLSVQAQADTIPTVTLGAGGPDQTLPLSSPFYLQGDASDASLQSVGAVFVRYSYKAWNIGTSTDCSAIGAAIAKLDLADDPQKPGTPLLFRGTSFETKLAGVWTPKAGEDGKPVAPPALYADIRGYPAYVAGAWTRASTSDKQFRFLVGADFFNAGARYCMFSYQRRRVTKDQTTTIGKIIAHFGTATEACGHSAKVAGVCEQRAVDTAIENIQALLKSPDSKTEDIKTSALDILTAGTDLADDTRKALALGGVLQQWIKPTIAVPGDNTKSDYARIITEPDPSPQATPANADDLLATIATRLLVREGIVALVPPTPPPPRGPAPAPRFYYEKGSFDVHHLGILDDYSGFRLIEDPAKTPGKRASVQVDLSKVVVPNSKLTLKDIVMLATHRIAYGDEFVSLQDLPLKISDGLAKSASTKDPTAAAQDAALTAFASGLREWDRLLTVSKDASDPLHVALFEWLTQRVLIGCRDVKPQGNATIATSKDQHALVYCLVAGETPLVPQESMGFTTKDEKVPYSPFAALADVIDEQAIHLKRVAALTSSEIQTKFADSAVTNPLDVSVQMTQKAFITTYVTPMVGYAYYASTHDQFWETALGIDVYAFPNPVDEPMWKNGVDDLRRLIALELAITPAASGFGPGGRYTTLNGVPPFFVGLALQLIPYVTVSGGCAVVGTRPPEVPQASTTVVAGFYTALSVQANLPDTIRALANGGSNTTTSNGAAK